MLHLSVLRSPRRVPRPLPSPRDVCREYTRVPSYADRAGPLLIPCDRLTVLANRDRSPLRDDSPRLPRPVLARTAHAQRVAPRRPRIAPPAVGPADPVLTLGIVPPAPKPRTVPTVAHPVTAGIHWLQLMTGLCGAD